MRSMVTPTDDSPTIGLVGDVMIQTPSILRRKTREPGVRKALDALGANSLVFGNLEMPLSQRGYRVPKHSSLRSDPAVITDVLELGIQAASVANNHMMDYGSAALEDTLSACAAAELPVCGAGRNLEEALAPIILEVGAYRVGFLSVSSTLPVESVAGPEKPGIAPIRVGFSYEVDCNLSLEQPGTMPVVRSWADPQDQDRVCVAINQLRQKVDTLIVAIHWGVPSFWLSPFQGVLASYQQPLGHALIDAGADVICGHHSHSLHPIEVYKGRPIFYSLGNFVFEEPRPFMEPESIMATMVLGPTPEFRLTPIMIDEQGFPTLAEATQMVDVLDKLDALSASAGTSLERTGNQARISLN
jgi:poly-gamma-glutamate synthesis protein (capsule biosynthesis protein)